MFLARLGEVLVVRSTQCGSVLEHKAHHMPLPATQVDRAQKKEMNDVFACFH